MKSDLSRIQALAFKKMSYVVSLMILMASFPLRIIIKKSKRGIWEWVLMSQLRNLTQKLSQTAMI